MRGATQGEYQEVSSTEAILEVSCHAPFLKESLELLHQHKKTNQIWSKSRNTEDGHWKEKRKPQTSNEGLHCASHFEDNCFQLCRRTMGSREEAFKPEMKMIC
jgi:hypothetical protein